MAMIFQDPMTSLNPVFTIGDQIIEALLPTTRDEDDAAMSGRSTCSRRSASPTPSGASISTRTSSRAACASGR